MKEKEYVIRIGMKVLERCVERYINGTVMLTEMRKHEGVVKDKWRGK